MKTAEELSAIKAEFEALNNKLAELNEDELEQVSGGSRNEVFAEGDWVNTNFNGYISIDGCTHIAYLVSAVSGINSFQKLTLQEYEVNLRNGSEPKLIGTYYNVLSCNCWHIAKPY